jgi:hypothetical protein
MGERQQTSDKCAELVSVQKNSQKSDLRKGEESALVDVIRLRL